MVNSEDPGWTDDPLRALLAFHGRIRAALASLDEFADAAGADPSSVDPMVARALYDFLTGPLVWHDVDEEASLMPRLRRVRHPPRVERLLARVTETHLEMERLIELLVPHLRSIAEDDLVANGERLREAATGLREILEPHLHMEEQEIIPLARLLLTREELEEMSEEMRLRLAERRSAMDEA